MDLELKDKVAFIAGSSRGIGLGIAESFLREGAKTIITGRGEAQLNDARETLAVESHGAPLLAIPGDLGDAAHVKRALQHTIDTFGRLDCVVVNIGSGKSIPGWDISREEWDAVFARNLWPSVLVAQEALRVMAPAKNGSILFIDSIAGISPTMAPLAYSAAKSALAAYAANLATLAAKDNIRVNCVAPGNIFFPGGSWEKRLNEREQEIRAYLESAVPMNRFGTTREIADIVTFLSSARASFVTGACWTADGGQIRKW